MFSSISPFINDMNFKTTVIDKIWQNTPNERPTIFYIIQAATNFGTKEHRKNWAYQRISVKCNNIKQLYTDSRGRTPNLYLLILPPMTDDLNAQYDFTQYWSNVVRRLVNDNIIVNNIVLGIAKTRKNRNFIKIPFSDFYITFDRKYLAAQLGQEFKNKNPNIFHCEGGETHYLNKILNYVEFREILKEYQKTKHIFWGGSSAGIINGGFSTSVAFLKKVLPNGYDEIKFASQRNNPKRNCQYDSNQHHTNYKNIFQQCIFEGMNIVPAIIYPHAQNFTDIKYNQSQFDQFYRLIYGDENNWGLLTDKFYDNNFKSIVNIIPILDGEAYVFGPAFTNRPELKRFNRLTLMRDHLDDNNVLKSELKTLTNKIQHILHIQKQNTRKLLKFIDFYNRTYNIYFKNRYRIIGSDNDKKSFKVFFRVNKKFDSQLFLPRREKIYLKKPLKNYSYYYIMNTRYQIVNRLFLRKKGKNIRQIKFLSEHETAIVLLRSYFNHVKEVFPNKLIIIYILDKLKNERALRIFVRSGLHYTNVKTNEGCVFIWSNKGLNNSQKKEILKTIGNNFFQTDSEQKKLYQIYQERPLILKLDRENKISTALQNNQYYQRASNINLLKYYHPREQRKTLDSKLSQLHKTSEYSLDTFNVQIKDKRYLIQFYKRYIWLLNNKPYDKSIYTFLHNQLFFRIGLEWEACWKNTILDQYLNKKYLKLDYDRSIFCRKDTLFEKYSQNKNKEVVINHDIELYTSPILTGQDQLIIILDKRYRIITVDRFDVFFAHIYNHFKELGIEDCVPEKNNRMGYDPNKSSCGFHIHIGDPFLKSNHVNGKLFLLNLTTFFYYIEKKKIIDKHFYRKNMQKESLISFYDHKDNKSDQHYGYFLTHLNSLGFNIDTKNMTQNQYISNYDSNKIEKVRKHLYRYLPNQRRVSLNILSRENHPDRQLNFRKSLEQNSKIHFEIRGHDDFTQIVKDQYQYKYNRDGLTPRQFDVDIAINLTKEYINYFLNLSVLSKILTYEMGQNNNFHFILDNIKEYDDFEEEPEKKEEEEEEEDIRRHDSNPDIQDSEDSEEEKIEDNFADYDFNDWDKGVSTDVEPMEIEMD